MNLAWGQKVSPAFRERVLRIAERLGCDPSHLMACMAFETGQSFSPSIRNPASSATGLIQFMAATARDLGTTTDALAGMTAAEQLDYVARYFEPYRGRVADIRDCYMAILWPKAVGKPDDFVLFRSPSKAYAANKGLDRDKKGYVTKADAAWPVELKLSQGLSHPNVWITEGQAPVPVEEKKMPLPILALISAFGPLIAELIPTVARVFDKTAENGAKLEAATKIIETVVRATDSTNVQEAVEKMQADPEVLKGAREAVVTEPEIMAILEVGGGIEAARAANLEMQNAPKSFLWNPAFWITLLLLAFPTALLADVFFFHPENYSGELRTQVVTAILGVVMVTSGYWLGTSAGSARKTDMLNERVKG